MGKDTKFNPAEADFVAKAPSVAKYTADDMRAAFMRGSSWSRQHVYNPIEMRPVKDAEEALANWPD
jgi:hypothetical protein